MHRPDLRLPKFTMAWCIPPARFYLPTIAVAVLGDDCETRIMCLVRDYIARWEEGLEIANRDSDVRDQDMRENGRGYLFLILADQAPATLKDATSLAAAAGELAFSKVLVAALGTTPQSALEQLTTTCAMTVITEAPDLLLSPLRWLTGFGRLIGYDPHDVFRASEGSIGQVRSSTCSGDSWLLDEAMNDATVKGIMCLVLSESEDSLEIAGKHISHAEAHRSDLTYVFAANDKIDGPNRIEWILMR